MRILSGAFALVLIVGQATIAVAAPSDYTCSAKLQALNDKWNVAAFLPPSKPMQARIVGRNGFEISGPDYRYIAGQLAQAQRECETGQEAAALHRTEAVSDRLAHWR